MEIAVLAGAGVVPPIEIVGKIKGAEVYGILMDYTALCVIFILYIDLTLEILNRTEISYVISGQISEAEIKEMINSIQ